MVINVITITITIAFLTVISSFIMNVIDCYYYVWFSYVYTCIL